MSSSLNLAELMLKITSSGVQVVDAITGKYLEEVVRHITERGDKIEDYSLVLVSNPMELKDSGLRVTTQYRVCRIDGLQNLPVYGED